MSQVGLRRLRRDPIGTLTTLVREQGDHATFRLGRQRVHVLTSPDLVEEAFVAHAQDVGKWGRVRRWWLRRPPSFVEGELLATHDRAEHVRARRALNPAFRERRVEGDVPQFAQLVDGYCEELAARGEPFELHRFSEALLAAGVLTSLFDETPRLDEAWELPALAHAVEPPTFSTFSARGFDLVEQLRYVRGFATVGAAMERLKPRMAELAEPGSGRPDSMPALLAAAGATDPAQHALSFLQTALDPASPSMTTMWLHAGREPPAFGHGVVMEALRLGAGWQVSRLCHEPFSIGETPVGPGDWLIAPPYVVHRDARFYPDPLAFRPERWAEPEASSRPRYAFLAFGVSSRVCLGRDLMIVQMLAALAAVTRRWVVACDRPPADVVWRATPRGDITPAGTPMATIRAR